MSKRYTTIATTVALFTTVLFLVALWFTPQADASEPGRPYGGCQESRQVLSGAISTQTEGVRWCRNHGWFIRPRIVIAPNGHAWTTLRQCSTEEAINASCYWDAIGSGNGHGFGFVALPGRSIYVDYVNGEQVTDDKYLGYMWMIVPWRG